MVDVVQDVHGGQNFISSQRRGHDSGPAASQIQPSPPFAKVNIRREGFIGDSLASLGSNVTYLARIGPANMEPRSMCIVSEI